MSKRLNNKGFTLVELLAVLVILLAIMGIAIPSISSSLERTKAKQNEVRYKMIESAAEQYVTDHKNAVYGKLGSNTKCFILVSKLKEYGYLTDDEMKDADGASLSTKYVVFTKPVTYDLIEAGGKGGASISCI